jgi:hypothetical protein
MKKPIGGNAFPIEVAFGIKSGGTQGFMPLFKMSGEEVPLCQMH